MERKDFLKNACKYGVCGCIGMSFLTGTEVFANTKSAQGDDQPDWRIDFMQSRYKDLIYILNDTLDKDTYSAVLKNWGANVVMILQTNIKTILKDILIS